MWTRAVLTTTGWDTPLHLEERADLPTPGPDEVVVAVGACGVAHRDLIDREGRLPFLSLPIVQGHELAGTVRAVGAAVTQWTVGDAVGALHRDHCGACARCREGETSHCAHAARVFGITIDGGYASHVIAPESALYRVPAELPLEHAAILNSTYGTAFRAMTRFIDPGPGCHVVVTGANGGVGLAGVQIAKALGATVTAVVRRAVHASHAESDGADHVVVDDGESFHKKLAAGAADIVLDTVGPPTFNASLRSLRLGGALALVGNVVEQRVELSVGRVVINDARICGSSGATRRDLAALLELTGRSQIRFVIADRMPLREADAAQRRLRAGGLHGRIVLVP